MKNKSYVVIIGYLNIVKLFQILCFDLGYLILANFAIFLQFVYYIVTTEKQNTVYQSFTYFCKPIIR